MRVIAGTAKGRRLRSLRGQTVRPTADRVKEALFSMLQSRFDLEGARVLDLFAGSGALGIEALSRGAERVIFVEEDRAVLQALRTNLEQCRFLARSRILAVPVRRAVAQLAAAGERFDGVLLDPPYGFGLAAAALAQLAAVGVVGPDGWAAAEHHVEDAIAEAYGTLRLTAARRYGNTALAIFSNSRMGQQGASS